MQSSKITNIKSCGRLWLNNLTPIKKSYLNNHLTALQISQHHKQQKKWMYHQQKVIDDKFLPRSLMYIKKKRGPKMEPCETPAIIGNHVED